MQQRRGYPPAAMRWNIEAENHEFAATAFHRSHLLGWPKGDAIVLIKQGSETVEVLVANNDLDAVRNIVAEVNRLLPREPASGDMVLPIMFGHQGEESVDATIR
jgi:hypothetical protein